MSFKAPGSRQEAAPRATFIRKARGTPFLSLSVPPQCARHRPLRGGRWVPGRLWWALAQAPPTRPMPAPPRRAVARLCRTPPVPTIRP